MAQSKNQLAASMKRTRLNLEEKVKNLDYAAKNPKKSCRDIAGEYFIGKITAANILKDAIKLRQEYDFFKGSFKTNQKET